MNKSNSLLRLDRVPVDRNDGQPHFRTANLYAAAKAYRLAGLSFIPIGTDGRKMPAFAHLPEVINPETGESHRRWGVLRERQPTADEIRSWFKGPAVDEIPGIGILGGAASGGLEILDVDSAETFEAFQKVLRKRLPRLLKKIVWVRSPRPGVHGYYRCSSPGRSQKLACRPVTDPATDRTTRKVLIETKGEGGYCVAPPSPPGCHVTGRRYRFLTGRDLTMIETLTDAERQSLLELAREFDEWPPAEAKTPPRRRYIIDVRDLYRMRPGDIFDATADWDDILTPKGWQFIGEGPEESLCWCRPGKIGGTSATTNYGGSDLLYVFSSNAYPFEEERAYTKFHAFTLLFYFGDWSAAAHAVRIGNYFSRHHNSFAAPQTLLEYYQ